MVSAVEPRSPILPAIPIEVALVGPSIVAAARQRQRYVLPFVIDAMVLIEDALHRTAVWVPTVRPEGVVMWPRPSALSNLMALRAVRVFGKPDLLDEVAEHLPRVAARKGVDPTPALNLIAQDYVPAMRLADPSGIRLPDAEERLADVAAKDADDEPTARLSRLLDPCVLLTRDRRSLLSNGFGGWVDDPEMDALVRITGDEWLKATLTVRDHAFMVQMESGGRAIAITGNVAASAIRRAVRLASDNPIPAALLLLGLVALIYYNRKSPLLTDIGSALSRATISAAVEIDARTKGRPAAALVAGPKVAAFLGAHAGTGDPVALVARTLAIAPTTGHSAAEIRAITGYAFAVRPILEAYPAFVRGEGPRWYLGAPAAERTAGPPWPVAADR